MNTKLISGLTATLLMTASIGASSSHAEQNPAESQTPQADSSAFHPSVPPEPRIRSEVKNGEPQFSSSTNSSSSEAVKLGEQQTSNSQSEDSIAKIQSHEHTGRKAATLYVKNIPVLTFVGPQRTASSDVKMGEVQTDETAKIARLKSGSGNVSGGTDSEQRQNSDHSGDPIARATAIAARLNQLYRQGVDAKSITVSWKPSDKSDKSKTAEKGQYVIESEKTMLVAVDAETILPDTTNSPERDALQVTNRLRRLIGDAAPLKEVTGKPKPDGQQISLGPIRLTIQGMASWYGPGFDGNLSASGEVFNQNALTAAHKSLPFGTKVQVTNLDNGRSVVVRINDRGPFVGDRVIDLSAGAARILGVINSGVAPVRLDILDSRKAPIATDNF